ncbi:IS3 family transposase [Pseudomonas sp. Hz4]
MGKYTVQAKLSAVQDYCSGKAGFREVAHRHNVDFSSLRQWVAAYQVHGAAALEAKKVQHYSVEFRLSVLKRMREERLSYRQVAALFDIRRFSIVGDWQRRYDGGDENALLIQPRRIGPVRKMPKPPEPALPQLPDESRSRDELIAELNQLRLENDYLKKLGRLGSKETSSAREQAQIVIELRQRHSLDGLLKVAGLARSTFYYQQKVLQAADKYADLKAKIREVFDADEGKLGYRRVTLAVRKDGYVISYKTVQRLMAELGLRCRVSVKKYRAYKGEVGRAAPNLLNRDFNASQPNQKWVTDVTEFKVSGQKLYLSPILDLYNGEIISYDIAKRPLFSMVGTMLSEAFKRLKSDEKPILHSDQGWQYRMPIYGQLLKEHSVTPSMSRKGNCYDNAAMESFFGTLKSEFFYLKKFENVDELHAGLVDYIHYYNHRRIKLKLNGLSPVEYRTQSVQV